MIKILKPENNYLLNYLLDNIRRVFNINPKIIKKISEKNFNKSIIFVANLKINQEKKIFEISKHSTFKVIYFGGFSNFFFKLFEFKKVNFKNDFKKEKPASRGKISNSKFKILYSKKNKLSPKIIERYLYRFDFDNEWNNYGYGKIDFLKKNIWSIKSLILCKKKNNIGKIKIQKKNLTFVSIHNIYKNELLFVNREAGIFDGFDVSILEKFISSHNLNLPNFPLISEIPYGYEGLVTMRLDCDENIQSSKSLFDMYKKKKIPFSLAILTSILDKKDKYYLQKIVNSKGSILSHSHEHLINFGDSYKSALLQIKKSIMELKKIGFDCKYIVAPFHHTPNFILKALQRLRLKGIVGGISLDNYREHITFRSGFFKNNKIILNNQQCMLHGDISPISKNLDIYKKSFLISFLNKRPFGFLDHPFSNRYKYGWKSEKYRLKIHEKFLKYIQKKGRILFLSQEDFLNFLYSKSKIKINENKNSFIFHAKNYKNYNYKVIYKDNKYLINSDKKKIIK